MEDDGTVNGMTMRRWLNVHSSGFTFLCLIHYIIMSFTCSRYRYLSCNWMLRKELRDEDHGRTNKILHNIHDAGRPEQIPYLHSWRIKPLLL